MQSKVADMKPANLEKREKNISPLLYICEPYDDKYKLYQHEQK